MRRENTMTAADAAEVTLHVAVLLEAGAIPDRVFDYIAEAHLDNGDAAANAVHRVREHIASGLSAADALDHEGGTWSWVASAWRIASAVGAPLSPALRSMAVVARDAQAAQDDVRIALAEPASTARLMLLLPFASLLMGVALGFDTVTILLTNPIGIACLIVGIGLVLVARAWTNKIVRTATSHRSAPGLREELTAIALAGGASPQRARQLIGDADIDELEPAAQTETIMRLSVIAGVPAVDLLRASASAAQQRARVGGRLRAAKLATALLLPLGACTLPAFFLLGVAPLMLSVISTTVIPL